MVTAVFWMYSKAVVRKGDGRERLGPSLAIGLPICIVGAMLAQVGYSMWVTGVQFSPPDWKKYVAVLPYGVESMMSAIVLWVALHIVHRRPAETRVLICRQVILLGMGYGIATAGFGYLAVEASEVLWMKYVGVSDTAAEEVEKLYLLVVFVLGPLIGVIALATAYAEWGSASVRSSFVYQG